MAQLLSSPMMLGFEVDSHINQHRHNTENSHSDPVQYSKNVSRLVWTSGRILSHRVSLVS